MNLFEFAPEVTHLIGNLIGGLLVVVLVIMAIRSYAKYKEVVNERDVAIRSLEAAVDDYYLATKDYARVFDNNTALLKKVKELEFKIKRSDQPRIGGRFSVKKAVKTNSNIGKYLCISGRLTNFKIGNYYEIHEDEISASCNLILIGDDRCRHSFSRQSAFFQLIEA